MKVAICIPVYDDTKALFTYSLAGMLIWSHGQPDSPIFNCHMLKGVSLVHVVRERLAEDALREDPDYLLWLDADQTFPLDSAARLIAHDLPIVGCNYRRKDPPNIPVSSAMREVGGQLLAITPAETGLEPVDTIGFGVCLIKAAVFWAVPKPWFSGGVDEDTAFFEKAKAAGFQPYVDHGLSREVGHIAETVLMFPR